MTTATPSFEHRIIDPEPPPDPHIKNTGDIAGRGLADLVVASSKGGPLVWYEAPHWTRHEIAPEGRWSCDCSIIDMDADGDGDLLISEWYTHDRLEWYENPLPAGDPRRDPWRRHIIGAPKAHHVEAVDLDGDGRPEIVIGDRWYTQPNDILRGTWRARVFAEWPEDATVVLHDLNGDGRLEAVMTRSEGPHRLSWWEAADDPAALWREHVIEESLDYGHSLKVCDFTADGLPDIVTAEMHQSERRRVLVFLNRGLDGSGEQRWDRHVLSTEGSHMLCVGNTTGNGRPDIMGANWSGDRQVLEMWRNLM